MVGWPGGSSGLVGLPACRLAARVDNTMDRCRCCWRCTDFVAFSFVWGVVGNPDSRRGGNPGYKVTGGDLSENSIREAQKWSSDSLSFEVHDMRCKIANRQFNAIFNLFTSFGYFDTFNENQLVCEAMHEMLEAGGKLVIDFMNVFRENTMKMAG